MPAVLQGFVDVDTTSESVSHMDTGRDARRFRIGVPMPTCCDIEQVKNLAAPSSDEGCHPPARLDIPLLLLCC
jgi:hypothetical protein